SYGLYFAPRDPAAWPLRLGMLLPYALILLAGGLWIVDCGLWILGKRSIYPQSAIRNPQSAIVLLPVAYLVAVALLTIPAQRYLLPAMPFVIILAAGPLYAGGAAVCARLFYNWA